MLSSDEEEVKARIRQHASALERKKKQKVWLTTRTGSLKNDKFDYAEQAADTSSLSTPTNENESPFSRDSLGDTVIHLDQVIVFLLSISLKKNPSLGLDLKLENSKLKLNLCR